MVEEHPGAARESWVAGRAGRFGLIDFTMSAHNRLTPGTRDRVASYALGLLDARQSRAFREHLAEGCSICQSELRAALKTVSCLSLAVADAAPLPHLRDRILDRVKSMPDPAPEGIHVVREGAGWQSAGMEGISTKQLYVDPARDSVTMLVRMQPGATYPSHRHGGPEQCFVLEGDLIQDIVLNAGDYTCAEPHTIHPVSRTTKGCLLLIVSSTHDEVMA